MNTKDPRTPQEKEKEQQEIYERNQDRFYKIWTFNGWLLMPSLVLLFLLACIVFVSGFGVLVGLGDALNNLNS